MRGLWLLNVLHPHETRGLILVRKVGKKEKKKKEKDCRGDLGCESGKWWAKGKNLQWQKSKIPQHLYHIYIKFISDFLDQIELSLSEMIMFEPSGPNFAFFFFK